MLWLWLVVRGCVLSVRCLRFAGCCLLPFDILRLLIGVCCVFVGVHCL